MSVMDSQYYLELFETFLNEKAGAYFPTNCHLNEAINYSLLSGGKRIRPLFCLGFSQLFNGKTDVALRCALAVEMVHAYSLIHDDLPAMDNDDMRRGRPTNHKVFGEAHAILAGDALMTAAPEILLRELSLINVPGDKIILLTIRLLEASGHEGMVKGQALDMEAEKGLQAPADQALFLKTIHENKTGKLILWSCLAGLYSSENNDLIEKYEVTVKLLGQKFGLLFQVIDDILDETSTLQDLGKTPGKDQKSGKLTYTKLHGLEGAKKLAGTILEEIDSELKKIEVKSGIIREIAQQLGNKI